jgi:hypothetical protein
MDSTTHSRHIPRFTFTCSGIAGQPSPIENSLTTA